MSYTLENAKEDIRLIDEGAEFICISYKYNIRYLQILLYSKSSYIEHLKLSLMSQEMPLQSFDSNRSAAIKRMEQSKNNYVLQVKIIRSNAIFSVGSISGAEELYEKTKKHKDGMEEVWDALKPMDDAINERRKMKVPHLGR